MAMNIKNERVHALAREAARRSGGTQTSALEAALEQYLQTLGDEGSASEAEDKLARAKRIVVEMRDSLTDEDRDAMRADLDEMYDEQGLPA